MAKSRDYKVKLYPAHKDGGFVVTKYDLFGNTPYPEQDITAAGMEDLVDQIRHFAMEHGDGCSASARVADGGRKPPGFKSATDSLYFNLKTKEELEAQEEAA
ncbi:MAG: hypothetical protein P1U83_11140 [Roseovarius sp.]|nr:hypothetical protein [Roseovarius sp.]